MDVSSPVRAGWTVKRIGFWLGPAVAGVLLLLPLPAGLTWPAWATAALLVWMAVWWASEAIPIPATSLLPLAVLPLIGAATAGEAAGGYASPIVLLLLGGFIIATGIERWGLHKRIALNVVARAGDHPRALVGGFMAATALLSMWISNTATTLMMVPIVLSVAGTLDTGESKRFTLALLLGVCYAASIGGTATPVGTPTNLIALDALAEISGGEIGFLAWLAFGIPAAGFMVPVAWWVVTQGLPKSASGGAAQDVVRRELQALGRISVPEARIAAVFAVVASLWIFRVPLQELGTVTGVTALTHLSDMGIAMAGAVAMFSFPSGRVGVRLLAWEDAAKLPWGVLILFGGGISLGRAITRTGLSAWLGEQLAVLSLFPPIFFIAIVVALVIFLTELTSNVATMTTLAPILGVLALAIGADPASLLAPAAVAASCAFMLPVATAPNAIIYATDQVTIGEMMRAGLRINLVGIAIITAIGYWIAPAVLG